MPAKVKSVAEPKMAFKGGDQGFIDLKLESVESVSANTKRLRFKLPEEDQVSGLKIACELLRSSIEYRG